jgi:hypothetical protein
VAADVINWIQEEETLEGRLRRIRRFLENEGYLLPEPPGGVDRSEEGDTHIVRGRRMTVEYTVMDQSGRRVYHYRENEVDHIMLRRIREGDEWAIEHISKIPQILRSGKVVASETDKVIYHSQRKYRCSEGNLHFLRVIIKSDPAGRWYVETFYPRPALR